MGHTPKEKKKKKKPNIRLASDREAERVGETFVLFLFSFYFIIRFTKICPSEFVGINTKSAIRDEGYA